MDIIGLAPSLILVCFSPSSPFSQWIALECLLHLSTLDFSMPSSKVHSQLDFLSIRATESCIEKFDHDLFPLLFEDPSAVSVIGIRLVECVFEIACSLLSSRPGQKSKIPSILLRVLSSGMHSQEVGRRAEEFLEACTLVEDDIEPFSVVFSSKKNISIGTSLLSCITRQFSNNCFILKLVSNLLRTCTYIYSLIILFIVFVFSPANQHIRVYIYDYTNIFV